MYSTRKRIPLVLLVVLLFVCTISTQPIALHSEDGLGTTLNEEDTGQQIKYDIEQTGLHSISDGSGGDVSTLGLGFTYGDNTHNYLYSIANTSDGGYVLAGKTNDGPYYDGWVVRVDSEGNELWNKTYGSDRNNQFNDVCVCSDGGFALTGSALTYVSVYHYFIWVIRTDENGTQLSERKYHGDYGAGGTSIIESSVGGLVFVGYLVEHDSTQARLYHRYPDGTQYIYSLGASMESYRFADVIQCENGDFVAVGQRRESDDHDWVIVRTDVNCSHIWTKTYGGDFKDHCISVTATSDGGFLLAGTKEFGTVDA